MRRYVYIGQVVGLLIGFYLLCLALIGGLIAITVLAFSTTGTNKLSVFLLAVSCAAIFVVLRGVFVSTHVKTKDIGGIRVYPADQPALWTRVRQLADAVGTRAPSRIYLVPDVNAAVWENTWLLGLIPGRRSLMIGVPLLMAMNPAQLDSVLAHEMGHYGNRDTQLGGLTGRARQSVLGALRAAGRPRKFALPGATMFVGVFRAYTKLVFRVTQEASRAQEYAADRVSARIVGPANAMAALRELPGISAAFEFYLDRYVGPGLEIGLAPPPPDLFGGFVGLLGEPSRRAELDELRDQLEEEETDPFDSHPPLADRIAALAAMPSNGVGADTSGRRAVAILANPADVLTRVGTVALQKHLVGKQVTSWDGLADAVGRHRVERRAKPLRDAVNQAVGRPAGPRALVELVAAGRFNEVLDALPRTEAASATNATGRVAREHAKTALGPMLSGWILSYLAQTGRVGWAHSWAEVGGDLRIAPELKRDVEAAVTGLTAVRPDVTGLRILVERLGVAA